MSEYIKNPLHVGISITDTDKSIQWYHDVIGFEMISSQYIPALKAVVTFLKKDNFELELFQCDEILQLNGIANVSGDNRILGTKHVAFLVSDMNELKKEFQRKNVSIIVESKINNEKVMFIKDPDDNVMEFIERTV